MHSPATDRPILEALLALFGAFIGGVITVQYMYAADRRKVRAEVVLEVVSYCDEIYHLIQLMHVVKDQLYNRDSSETPETGTNYTESSKRLTLLLKTSVPRVKLAIAYGEGDALRDFNLLADQFRDVASILRQATRAAWAQENREIHQRFTKLIDPMRATLENRLLSDVRAASIWVLLRRG
jgi:hypothetical protein